MPRNHNVVKKSKKKSVVRDNEELWEYCKKEAIKKMGKFSARAMQYAVVLYKKSGGGYLGQKSSGNSLTKWNKSQVSKNIF